MGGPVGQAMLNGFIPNGLLPNEATSVARMLDPERWSRIEERTTELITHIQPNKSSEGRRNAVASYVQRLIKKCFSCEVFTFGSVPLKTYLPDGDIDLTAFSNNQTLMDSWADEVCNVLKCEERSEDAEFCVKEVHYIQAEVKIVKCIVENIVVDISFNQLGGLCTLCFLDEVDDLISQDHLFKRSIILIKAWCYYESRILGAHHGLISTYALETLVLYIFHIYNNKFAGPLEVLYRFLEFFSKFDWNNYCLSLRGPVPISSLPDMRAEPPLKDGGELLLSKVFLDSCGSVYTAIPGSQEHQRQPHQGQPFISKYFNIIDPLRANNNLGRSVSKGNFSRIKSAFAFGAQQLVWLLDCPEENLIAEFDLFFRSTCDRHGKGHRPDAPKYIICSKNLEVTKNSKCHEFKVEGVHTSHAGNTERGNGHFSSSKIHSNKKLSLRSKVSNHCSSSKNGNNKKLSLRSKVSNNHSDRVSAKNKKSSWHTSSHWRSDYADDSENAYDGEFGLGFIEEDGLSVEKAMWIRQEEQDFVNGMMTWGYPNFNSYVEAPVNANYTYIPFYMLPPTLTSGYIDADSFGMLSANVPFESFWGHNMTSIQGDLSEAMSENLVVSEFYLEDGNGDEWPELNVNLVRGYGYEDGGIQAQQQKDREALASVGYSAGYSSCQTSSGSYSSKDYGETIKNRWLTRENYGQDPLDERTIEIDENSTSDSFTPATYSMDSDAEPGSHHAGQLNVNLDSTWSPKLSDTLNMPNYIRHDATLECLEKEKFDIFKGDFSSHWKNLQYGRLCQSLEFQELLPYPPSFVVPPIYLQGQYPCDGYGGPATNMSSHIIPMVPVQNGSDSPTDINQCFTRELPTFRGGTGTYFPNPTSYEKFFRQRQYANYRNRRGNHFHDRRDHHGERERNRNFNSKPSFSGHNHYHCQVYRPVIRMDRTDLGKRGPEKQWNSFKHGFSSSYNYCNGSFKSSVSNSYISDDVPYGMHPLSVVGSSEISLSETANPPVSMQHPYDPNISNTSSNLPEFGSFGPVQFSGTSRALHRGESSNTVVDVEANFEGYSPDSSPNYPSSHNF